MDSRRPDLLPVFSWWFHPMTVRQIVSQNQLLSCSLSFLPPPSSIPLLFPSLLSLPFSKKILLIDRFRYCEICDFALRDLFLWNEIFATWIHRDETQKNSALCIYSAPSSIFFPFWNATEFFLFSRICLILSRISISFLVQAFSRWHPVKSFEGSKIIFDIWS